jgi:hypothetical protein
MKTTFLLLLLLLPTIGLHLSAQNPATEPDARIARDTFDPDRHALGRLRAGSVELLVDARVLLRSIQVLLPEMERVETIEKQRIGEADFLVFAGWFNGAVYRRNLLAVRLKTDREGFVFADAYFKICTAREEAVCSDCVLTSAGCRCWSSEDDYCRSAAGSFQVFSKISTIIK